MQNPNPNAGSTLAETLLRANEAAAEFRCGRSTFLRLVKAGKAPAPIRISPKRPLWRKNDLAEFLATAAAK
jgi:predicted DNA-binding transcriptional regulator AlpA